MKFNIIAAMGVFSYLQDNALLLRILYLYLEKGGYIVASNANNLSLHTLPAIAAHLASWRPSKSWRESARAILRTGLDTGGFVDYNPRQQCYGAAAFDSLFAEQGFVKIKDIDLYCLNPLPLEINALKRTKIGQYIARNLGFNHIGLYRKSQSKLSGAKEE